ncbi:MAG: ATP-dependent Clp protease adaptor ClpS, partial [Burkholderiales bacterium]|nr:ATP-dependent Clp protease adaptor ClpS [Burkholderiales bacterium]
MATRQEPSTVLERKEKRLEPPPMYEVMLLNDDFTPMEFVV